MYKNILKFKFLAISLPFCLVCAPATPTHAAQNTSAIAVSLPPALDLSVLPTETGAVGFGSASLQISSTDISEFKILIQGSNNLKLTNSQGDYNIPSIQKKAALKDFPLNTWGINLAEDIPNQNSTFLPISTTNTEIIANPSPSATETYNFAVGLKVNTNLPAGIYRNQIVISVVATPRPKNDLSEISYMQDITPGICANSELEQTYTLVDKRDSKEYKVARLKDGNCWMQENLKLSLNTKVALTSETSDLVEGTTYTPLRNTLDQSSNPPDAGGEASWHVGDEWYYQHSTAVAGSWRKVADNQAAPSSICPKGWKLPFAGTKYNNISGSFYKLLSAYNYSSGSDATVTKDPLYFTRSGEVWVSGITGVGSYAAYKSCVTQTEASYSGYILYFRNNNVNPNQAEAMGGGGSVRCFSYGL